MSPGNIEAAKAAAEVMIQLNRKAEARLYLENYLSSAGADVGAYELAGRLAMMNQEYDKAVRYYQRAHDMAPEEPALPRNARSGADTERRLRRRR